MRILVTGGYGFIGLAVVEGLLKENHSITVIDDLSAPNSFNQIKNVSFFNISAGSNKCETIFRDNKFDIVIHLANKKLTKENVDEYSHILQSNNKGLINILYYSEKFDVKKFITISHYNVYGIQDSLPITEEDNLNPKDEQGYHGVIRELYCDQYRRKGLNAITLRVGEVYGPRMNNPSSFIQKLLSISNLDEELKIIKNKLDYIYIGDLVEAIKIVCEKHSPSILNISSNQGSTQNEILELFSTISHKYKNIRIKADHNIEHEYVLDNKRAKLNLNWSPKYDLTQGIIRTIQWYENNNIIASDEVTIKRDKPRESYKIGKNYRDIENILLFIIFATLNYLIRYKLSIKVDLFILYIVFINLIYGFKQGSIAVILSIIANIWFKMTFEGMKTFNLINDPSNLLYSTIYFIIGISIGNMVDRIKIEKEILTLDLEDLKEEMSFTYEVYDQSIEIKNTLQNTIENYDNSFQKTLETITKLEETDSNSILNESQKLLIKILKNKNIYIYSVTADKEYIKLVASPEIRNFNSLIRIDENEFLNKVAIEQKIFINKSLEKTFPTIAAPLFKDKKVVAIIFIDQIEFQLLNYQLLDTIKVLIYLISNKLSGVKDYIKTLSNSDTTIKE